MGGLIARPSGLTRQAEAGCASLQHMADLPGYVVASP